MKLAVISDIHGNLEALEAVLEDIARRSVSHIICLGDVVGYGPDSEAVVEIVRRQAIPTIAGNHEKAIQDPFFLSWFNPPARASLVQTRAMLSAASCKWIGTLPRFNMDHNSYFVHGFPPDSQTTYLFQVSSQRLKAAVKRLPVPLCFVGHTHELEIVTVAANGRLVRALPSNPVNRLHPDNRYIINVGSVGQPRDGQPGAKYVIWHPADETLEVRQVPFDVARVVEKMHRAGLPNVHAERLQVA